MKIFLMLCSTALLILTSTPTARCIIDKTKIDEFVEQHMNSHNIPGVAVAVIKGDQIIFSNAYGLSNLALQTSTTPQSVFEIASLTKPLTASAILRLVDNEKLELDRPITDYLEDVPAAWSEITTRNLLSHTAGFPEQLIVGCDGAASLNVSTKAQLQMIVDSPALFPAGSGSAYSDPGYFLLGMIIEAVSGHKYSDAMRELLFDPANMSHSSLLNQWEIVPLRVSGYTMREGRILNARRDWQHELPSFFGVMSNVNDISNFAISYMNNELFSKHIRSQMESVSRLNSGAQATVWGRPYGLGWLVGDYRGRKVVEHGGFSGTHLMIFPDDDFAVVALTNLDIRSGSAPNLITRGIAGLVSTEYLIPHMMGENEDPRSKQSENLKNVLQELNAPSNVSLLSESYRERLLNLPRHVRERITKSYSSVTALRYLSEDRLESTLDRFDCDVERIVYYKAEMKSGMLYLSVWYDKSQSIVDISSYKP